MNGVKKLRTVTLERHAELSARNSYNPRMAKAGRNDLCPCGSGKKYKKCHAQKQPQNRASLLLVGLLVAALAGGVYAAVVGFGDTGSATSAPGQVWSPEHGHYH